MCKTAFLLLVHVDAEPVTILLEASLFCLITESISVDKLLSYSNLD